MDMSQLLPMLMSPENGLRVQAESAYKSQCDASPDVMASQLSECLAHHENATLRSFAGVLLRRVLDVYAERMASTTFATIRTRLIDAWVKEDSPVIIKRLNHIIAQSVARGDWNEILPFLMASCAKLNTVNVISVLEIIEILSDYSPDQIFANIAALGNFLGGLISSPDYKVAIACAKATAACIVSIDDEGARNSFKVALPPIIAVLGQCFRQGSETDAAAIIEHLVAIAQMQPLFFKGALDDLVSAMLTVTATSSLEFSSRSIALELVVTMCETAPALARRCAPLIDGCLSTVLGMMVDVETSEKEWMSTKYGEESFDGDETCLVAEEALERIAAGLGGKVVLPIAMPILQSFAGSQDWKHRRAAVAAMARLAEGTTKLFQPYLSASCDFLASSLGDSSFRVHYEAAQAVGQMSVLFPDASDAFIKRFLPLLVGILSNGASCDRVRAHAASALINLCNPETADADALTPLIETTLSAIVGCLQHASLEVQGPCLVLLGCVAQSSEAAFAPYYSSLMPGIKAILANGQVGSVIRGKAMECAGLLIEAAGSIASSSDATDVLQFLIRYSEMDPDSAFEYSLPACARIAKAMKADFLPYLQPIMPLLLRGAAQDIQFTMEDVQEGEDEDDEVENDEEGRLHTAIITLGKGIKKRVTLSVHAVQQKTQATRIIFELSSSLKGGMGVQLCQCVQALVPNLTDKHSAEIRSAASLALSSVFDALVQAALTSGCTGDLYGPFGSLSAVLVLCITKLSESLRGENNATSRVSASEALRDVLTACYSSGSDVAEGVKGNFFCCPEQSLSISLIKEIMERCKECLGRREQLSNAGKQDERLDAEDLEEPDEDLEAEDDLMANLVDALGHFVKLHGESIMPVFDSVVAPAFASLLSPAQPEPLQVVGICIIDDIVEFGGTFAKKYVTQIMPLLMGFLGASHNVVRQASSYGVAQVARKHPELFAAYLVPVLPTLLQLLAGLNADDEDNIGCIENVAFALAVIYCTPAYRQGDWGTVSHQLVASAWLARLPLRADETEAKVAHSLLCDCIEMQDSLILGSNKANIGRILAISADVFRSAFEHDQDPGSVVLASTNTLNRLVQALKHILADIPQPSITSVMHDLSMEQQQALVKALGL